MGTVCVVQDPTVYSEEQRQRDVKLGFLFHDVSRLRRKAYDEFMRPLGITRARWWVIANLSRRDGMTQTELADLMDVGKPNLGNLIAHLELDGWVTRWSDLKDRRVKRVYLTSNSQKLLSKMMAYERAFNQQALRGLSDADHESLLMLLTTVRNSLLGMDNSRTSDREGSVNLNSSIRG